MGSVNYGSQIKTVEFNADASDYSFNIRNLGIIPVGIYSGGLLVAETGNNFHISPLVAEISDSNGNYQVRLQTTMDIGGLVADSSTPYVVLNWAYTQIVGQNYVDVILTNNLAAYPNGLIVGKCLFSGSNLTGFEYGSGTTYKRTVPNLPQLQFSVVPDYTANANVYVTAGQAPNINGNNITGLLQTHFAKFTMTNPLNVIYLNRSQSPGYVTLTVGSAYPTGTYGQYIPIAEVTLSGGVVTAIKDVRSFVW